MVDKIKKNRTNVLSKREVGIIHMGSKSLSNARTGQSLVDSLIIGQEKLLYKVVDDVGKALSIEYGYNIRHEPSLGLSNFTDDLDEDAYIFSDKTFIKPDGGILSIYDNNDCMVIILAAERKNQGATGTNGLINESGGGNVYERLGKMKEAFDSWFRNDLILPFIVFGHGSSFSKNKTSFDHLALINDCGKINKLFLQKNNNRNRASFFFRETNWTYEEMYELVYVLAKHALIYYIEKFDDLERIQNDKTIVHVGGRENTIDQTLFAISA